jgi:hypothetical protein
LIAQAYLCLTNFNFSHIKTAVISILTDPGILNELTGYLMLADLIAAIIALVFGAGTRRSAGTTKILGTFISVGLMSAAVMIFLILAGIASYLHGIVLFYLFLFAFSVLVSIITGAVIICRIFPDKKPNPAANDQKQQEKEKNEPKDQSQQT